MSGETEGNVSGWTTDTLHAHMVSQFEALESLLSERAQNQSKAINAALLSAEKAVGKAEAATEKRFDSVNEFRAQLTDQAGQFMPREVADAQLAELRIKIGDLTSQINSIMAVQVAAQRTLTVGLTIATVMISIIVLLANNVF